LIWSRCQNPLCPGLPRQQQRLVFVNSSSFRAPPWQQASRCCQVRVQGAVPGMVLPGSSRARSSTRSAARGGTNSGMGACARSSNQERCQQQHQQNNAGGTVNSTRTDALGKRCRGRSGGKSGTGSCHAQTAACAVPGSESQERDPERLVVAGEALQRASIVICGSCYCMVRLCTYMAVRSGVPSPPGLSRRQMQPPTLYRCQPPIQERWGRPSGARTAQPACQHPPVRQSWPPPLVGSGHPARMHSPLQRASPESALLPAVPVNPHHACIIHSPCGC
jgi:hypothetical protein